MRTNDRHMKVAAANNFVVRELSVTFIYTESSSARSEHCAWDAGVAGSNPAFPTIAQLGKLAKPLDLGSSV